MMEDRWEFYPSRVDDELASIYVNLSYRARCPLVDAADLAWLRVYFLKPRDDGLSSHEEFQTLCGVEDAVVNQFAAEDTVAYYVGRNTSGGCRDFYFYTDNGHKAELLFSQAMAQFAEYEFDVGHRHEPEWSVYCDFLFPSPRDMQIIKNQNVIETLEEANDQLYVSRTVLHWAYFPNLPTRNEFVARSSEHGFCLHHLIDPNPEDNKYGVVLSYNHAVDYRSINEVTLMLYDITAELGGNYDGWETPVVAGFQNNLPQK
jgi:uncharacterized protein (TIGR01619 family)